ncbi:MAG: arsenosugar biosynthesis radical SAM protein ArsS [Desulfobulbaceae bacterium]|nr:arsenosugar biosynthesis radical SAM protein ArsS [Desulfobulbaceae bacterium]
MNSFLTVLDSNNLSLTRSQTSTLQVNVGRLCNLACRHCHVEAGPGCLEVMDRKTMDDVIRFAGNNSFSRIDITGGAPELVPDIEYLLENLVSLAPTLMLRTNLIALLEEKPELLNFCRRLKIALVASFPSTNRGQADAQRGEGVWEKSIFMLKKLNDLGYGKAGTGLDLYLVSNPSGAFLPADQCTAEKKFKTSLANRWGIEFTALYNFANFPLGRFKTWLEKSGNYNAYMDKLRSSFNPTTIEGLMCRSLINISWDGYLYDCDFNMAAGLPYSGKPLHVSDVEKPDEGGPIMTDDYCFACTAGSGFT